MTYKTPSSPLFGPDFKFSGDTTERERELEDWLYKHMRSLEDTFKKVYSDISQGNAAHRLYHVSASTSDMSTGEITLYSDGSAPVNYRLYVNVSGTSRYVGLT